jgi:hypothetical protein
MPILYYYNIRSVRIRTIRIDFVRCVLLFDYNYTVYCIPLADIEYLNKSIVIILLLLLHYGNRYSKRFNHVHRSSAVFFFFGSNRVFTPDTALKYEYIEIRSLVYGF